MNLTLGSSIFFIKASTLVKNVSSLNPAGHLLMIIAVLSYNSLGCETKKSIKLVRRLLVPYIGALVYFSSMTKTKTAEDIDLSK